MLEISPYAEEIRQEGRIEARKQDMLAVLETRFPGAVPPEVVKRIKAETDLDKLSRWLKLAIMETLEQFQAAMD